MEYALLIFFLIAAMLLAGIVISASMPVLECRPARSRRVRPSKGG